MQCGSIRGFRPNFEKNTESEKRFRTAREHMQEFPPSLVSIFGAMKIIVTSKCTNKNVNCWFCTSGEDARTVSLKITTTVDQRPINGTF